MMPPKMRIDLPLTTNVQQGRTMRNWTDSSTFGMVGCFFAFLLLVIMAGWITLRIMEAMSPA
jgi:hypothetical protein